MNYKQFKLTNGEELICDVVDEADDDVNLVVRHAMAISVRETSDGHIRYYTFRPWMVYQLRKDYFQLINETHIIGEGNPDPEVLNQYKLALEGELSNEPNSMSDNQSDLEDALDRLSNMIQNCDSSDDVVINLFDRKKLH